MVGDIVGGPGRRAFVRLVPAWKEKGTVDAVVANAENAAGGKGLTRSVAEELFDAGADVIVLGDHAWDQKDIIPHIAGERRLVRPANFAPGCPGRGVTTVDTPHGRLSVVSLVGRVFMPPAECPFRTADALLGKEPNLGKVIAVDVHAEATSEKIALGWYLDGRVSAVAGTHTHVQTSDERVLPKKTAYITDLGMTGPRDSVIGREKKAILEKFVTGMPTKFEIAEDDVVLEGAIVEVDETTGHARRITRVRESVDAARKGP
jgi:metallophosphoesterase (TIGR00282 family)